MSSPDGSTVTFRRPPADVRPAVIGRFARKLQRDVARGASFDCLITGDAEMRRLNREFRGKDYATDVLSFPALAPLSRSARPVGKDSRVLGDIAISVMKARTQARGFGHSTEEELRVLLLHGVLHLLGMDHETDSGRMARAEQQWRRKLGLPNGLIERVRA